MTRARSVLLAALIVCSAVVGAVGPALAQTATDSGPVTYGYTGSPTTLIVDTSNLDGGTEFTVEYTTQGGPSTGTTVLARETYNTANLKEDQLLFFNDGAYESVNVTVSDYSGGEPTFDSKSGLLGGVNLVRTVVGTTGGDSDLTCDTSDKIGNALSGVENLDCTPQPGTTTVNTTNTDTAQVKTDIYQSALNSNASTDNTLTVLNNDLKDAKTQARIEGKNAYIRALNNGSSKSAAKNAAKEAVSDFYATHQRNLLAEYTLTVSHFKYLRSTALNESIDSSYVDTDDQSLSSTGDYTYNWNQPTDSVTLTDGTTEDYTYVQISKTYGPGGDTETYDHYITNTAKSGATLGISAKSLGVHGYSSDTSYVAVVPFERFQSTWTTIENQDQTVRNEMDTLAENTYSAYQAGEINNSDLVDPYVLASQQSPGDDFQGWAAAQLTLLGTNSPENFDQIGSFQITTESGTQYEGVLFSQENPASGQFENGTTYNTSNIGGTQYVVTSDRIVELDGEFTIDSISTQDGQTVQNVTIQKTTYETTNVTELKQQYEDLAYKRAQIEAREKALKQSAGGGFLGGGSVPPVVALAVIGTLLAIVVLQN
ncbi:hypothetical protein BVU17_13760 [Haloarcula taiwanensis]|uniref:Envelope protein N-terminal domain-containing protein n=1 Tax=Haloarcula taiwanensis TaxID=1932004 RepID=A0A2H5A1B8_9EURY|nr:hypothetical protein [Haloarcula taiwanensis]AUG48539.1 hypothetical protein BVU17_13760 [Haloarcula taiwanensis]